MCTFNILLICGRCGNFGRHNMFHDYLAGVAAKDINDVRDALVELFSILDTKESERDPYKNQSCWSSHM